MMNTLHIATGEYCFAEVPFEGTAEEAVVEAKRLQAVVNQPGLSDPDWRAALDDYLENDSINGDPGMFEVMNASQRWCMNEIKKSNKRRK